MRNKEELLKLIKEYLGCNFDGYTHTYIEFSGKSPSYIIKYGQMYDVPKLNFGDLIKLSELLGTVDINVDNYSMGGCESCDYGSDYGHEISIKNVTKNLDLMEQLIGIKYGEK